MKINIGIFPLLWSNTTETRKGVPGLQGPDLLCLSAIDKKTVYWSSSLARILHIQNIIRREPRRQVQIYLWRVFLSSPSLVLANINSILAFDVPGTEDVGLPTKFRSMLGQLCSPLLVQCRSIVYDAGPTLIYHGVCCILCANTWHSTNAVSMLTPQSSKLSRHWNSIGWLYRVFWPLHYAGDALTSRRQKHGITRYIGPMLSVMLGHRLRRWANIIPTKTL